MVGDRMSQWNDLDKIIKDYIEACENEGPQDCEHWLQRYPNHADALADYFAEAQQLDLPRTELELPETESQTPGKEHEARRCVVEYEVGQLIGGKYRVLDTKRGGMGRVYIVNGSGNDDMNPRAVMKTLLPYETWSMRRDDHSATSLRARYAAMLQRFRRESMIWIGLGNHRHVIRAVCVMEVSGRPYLFLEYANQGSIADWIQAGRLDLSRSIDLILQFCAGMAFAYKTEGIVHRDIKPANILVHDGIAKVADFGLAGKIGEFVKVSESFLPVSPPNQSEDGAGTQAYMAPEQFLSLRDADTRSDIFSTGVTLFEMLTGERLFHGTDAFTASRSNHKLPSVRDIIPNVPETVSSIVDRCVAYDPNQRYQSFVQLGKDLLDCGVPTRWRRVKRERSEADERCDSKQSVSMKSHSLNSLGLYEQAERHTSEALGDDPEFYGHWLDRGKALAELRRFDEALECYEKAKKLAPDRHDCWFNIAYALVSLGRPSEGLEAARRAKQLNTHCSEAWDAEGCCLADVGELNAAIDSFRGATDVDSDNWRAHGNLGRALAMAGKSPAAKASLLAAVKINPRASGAWFELAGIHAGDADFYEAQRALDECLQSDQGHSQAWMMKGGLIAETARSRADLQEAKVAISRAVELNQQLDRMGKILMGQIDRQIDAFG